MPKFSDLTGQKFNRLTVLSRGKSPKGERSRWNCVCACGKLVPNVTCSSLTRNAAISCGCADTHKGRKLHGLSRTRPHQIWMNMLNRCYNANVPAYRNYGARGITVCDLWKSSFLSFWNDMKDTYSPQLTIERKNNNLGYSKDNCCWATYQEQARNTRINRMILTPRGKLPLAEAAEILGISKSAICYRIRNGWTETEWGLPKQRPWSRAAKNSRK